MNRHLVIFLRHPQLGRGKTRLARAIGPLAALRFARQSATTLIARLGRDPRWHCWLAITPDAAVHQPHSWPPARRRPQGGGDLGQRMARQFRQLRGGPVVIIGSDLPDLSAAQIWRAFRALGHHDLVFGPANDGGYWLVGARPTVHMPAVFASVRWSSDHTLADTLANLRPHQRVALLETLTDIDDGPSYTAWQQRHRGRLPHRIVL